MILHQCSEIYDSDVSRYAWSSLRRFQHVPTTMRRIEQIHNPPEKQRANVQKQAHQIRQCLIQAKEYRDAAEVTTLATKPVLLYYSIMSLALAEILLKSDGRVSLDAARGEHSHHGLTLGVAKRGHADYDLKKTAALLSAQPLLASGKRRGTFELWHRVAREGPSVGLMQNYRSEGSTRHPAVLLVGDDQRIGYLEESGITLLDCFIGCPGASHYIWNYGIVSRTVRGTLGMVRNYDEDQETLSLTIHPHRDSNVTQEFSEQFQFSARDFECLRIIGYTSGFTISYTNDISRMDKEFKIPSSVNWSQDDIIFLDSKWPLNEFGYLYVGLYILGNFARYYPDQWMDDVNEGAPLALASEEFLAMAERRMALLTLSELSGIYHYQ